MITSNIHLLNFPEFPYHRGFNIVIFNLWFPVITSVDSCNKSCVGKHRDTEYFSVFFVFFFVTVCVYVNSYCSITSWSLSCPGRLFVQQFCKIGCLHRKLTSYSLMSSFNHQGLKKKSFSCNHRNVIWLQCLQCQSAGLLLPVITQL